MLKLTITRLMVMLFVLTLLASGCAKKPVAEQTTPMVEQPVVEVQSFLMIDFQDFFLGH